MPAARLRRWSLAVCGLIALQMVFGAVLRHTYSPVGQRGHLLVAFGVVATVAWLVKGAYDGPGRDRRLTAAATCLAAMTIA